MLYGVSIKQKINQCLRLELLPDQLSNVNGMYVTHKIHKLRL